MEKTDFGNAFELIKAAKTIAIVGHVRPDGDCLGSSLALKMIAESMGKTADVYMDGEIPKQMFYIKGYNAIKTDVKDMGAEYDLLVTMDTSSEDRLGIFTNLRQFSKKVLCIDHHIDTRVKADTLVTNPNSASCGEMLYDFVISNKIAIDKDIATALYTAVSTDTGCFLYAATTAFTHRTAAQLLDYDIDIELIHYNNFRVYDRRFIAGFRQILRRLRFRKGGQIAFTCLDMRNSKKYNFDFEERHRFKQYASDARGVVTSIFMTQEERNLYHVSLRSHGNINVATVARFFGGGGHKNAAGFTIRGKYKKVIKQIVRELEKVLQ